MDFKRRPNGEGTPECPQEEHSPSEGIQGKRVFVGAHGVSRHLEGTGWLFLPSPYVRTPITDRRPLGDGHPVTNS